MPIHKDVIELYKKYYDSDKAVGVDRYFLEDVSKIIYGLEKTLRKFVYGSNQIE